MSENNISEHRIDKTVDNTIKAGSIIWLKSSCGAIHCGKVSNVNYKDRQANVFNYDAWSAWTVDF